LGRDLAIEVYYLCDQAGMYAHAAWSQALSGELVDTRERKVGMEIAFGAIRRKLTLEWMIAQASRRPVRRIDPLARAIIATGLYQVRFMGSVPPHAAVSEAVGSARRLGHRGLPGFVNAVLRTLTSPGFSPDFPDVRSDPVAHISVVHSHPAWIVRMWIEQHGLERTIAMCEAGNTAPPLTVRVNTMQTDAAHLGSLLRAGGTHVTPGRYLPEALILDPPESLGAIPEHQAGLMTVQDESSMMVAHALAPCPGWTVIDACAAPGGKTTHMAELMGDEGRIIAADPNPARLPMVSQAAERLRLSSIETVDADARHLGDMFPGTADAVLVDAPCSGLGVLSRRADARWRKSPDDITSLSRLQAEILDSAARTLKPSGVLVYSTCTVSQAENQDQITAFLDRNPQFAPSSLLPFIPEGARQAVAPGNPHMLQLLPGIHGTDGFFIARLERRSSTNASPS
jgi:16S rRNA (cytosine967-C5)-methyltransferase